MPESAYRARAASRQPCLPRSHRPLPGRGIRPFFAIGTGVPAFNNTHEIARSIASEGRGVYVDNDPIVLAHARALLTSGPAGLTSYIDADLQNTGQILDTAALTLDFSRPVAVVLMAILHLIGDEDDPYGIVATLMDAVPPGSYLTLSHIASDIETEALGEARDRVSKFMPVKQTYRSHAEVLRFFDGLDMVGPGLVRVQEWRPRTEAEATGPAALWGGVGRKR
jgi:hypothetical protein